MIMDYTNAIIPKHPVRYCAAVSGYSEASWRKWIADGRVEVERLGHGVRISDEELRRFLREGPRKLKAETVA
jgi:hypothetical protein